MEPSPASDELILRGLNAHPQIKQRVVSLLAAVENAQGDLRQADEAEWRMIEEVRQMGQEALQAWAQTRVEQSEQALSASAQVHREGKKNSAGTARLGK